MQCLQKKFQVETEVENWIQKYDEDMGAKQVYMINPNLEQFLYQLQLFTTDKMHKAGGGGEVSWCLLLKSLEFRERVT